MSLSPIKSVAIIGAGAAGAATAAAFAAEESFDVIRVFERRETPGGTWIYDPDPGRATELLHPGKLPPQSDPPLRIPKDLPRSTTPVSQNRYDRTPIYQGLTTNIPDIAMSFSDRPFAYGPFVPHWVPKQYIENYFSSHRTDLLLVLNTTVEDVSKLPARKNHNERWKLTLRRHDPVANVDEWWGEEFDAVIFANGHYSVPIVPPVEGLNEYIKKFPERISHSKSYRTAEQFANKRVIVIGNSASGHDITTLLVESEKPQIPLYQSRRSKSRWDRADPPEGIEWKPIVERYDPETDEIIFSDGTVLRNIDAVIYCTGYRASFPFWNEAANGGPIYDYAEGHLEGFYQHTFSRSFPRTLGIVGLPRVLTFRSFEYQAIALARLFSVRNAKSLPPRSEQVEWEQERGQLVKKERRKFHDVQWDSGEAMAWFQFLFEMSGLPQLEGKGKYPPVLSEETRWAIEHVKKYPEPKPRDGDRKDDLEDEDG